MRETWIWSLGWEDPLKKGNATHSRFLAWRIRWSMGSQSRTWLSDFHFTFHWIIEKKQGNSRKKMSFCFIDYAKAFDYVDHNKLWKILQEMGIPDHLTCLLRNLYANQEATVRTGHGTTDWLHIGKGVRWGCILSPCLFNLYVEYIMRNAGLHEVQAGVKIAGRNINNLR